MNIFQKIGGYLMGLFTQDAQQIFDVKAISSNEMQRAQDEWNKIIKGQPNWISGQVSSINFAKFICQYSAKKTCLDLSVRVEGSERAEFINAVIKSMVSSRLRDKVEDALGMGGIVLKPNGNTAANNAVDYIMPWDFLITEKTSNGDIRGIIFFDRIQKGDAHFTRLEYHHFVHGLNDQGEEVDGYVIENRAFKSSNDTNLGGEIPLEYVPEWAGHEPVVTMLNIDKPLFGYLKMPWNNTIDYGSPEGVSIFANAIVELKDLDVAWSKKGNEVSTSEHITFVDESTLVKTDAKGNKTRLQLPSFVKGLRSKGIDVQSTIQEHVPTLLTEQRIADINSILSMLSTKCGFSQGQFVLDRKTGMMTATQIESDDSETVETITDVRTSLKAAVKDLIYALDKYCDLVYGIPSGYVNALDENVMDEDIFYFKDLMASFEQDRQRAYQLMNMGIYSKVKYLTEYEGFSEEEAEEMLAQAQSEKSVDLFTAE